MIQNIVTKILFISILIFIILSILIIHHFSNNILHFKRIQLTKDNELNLKNLNLDFSNEKITINKNNYCYAWFIKSKIQTNKTVVLVHGRQSNKEKLTKYISFLNQAHYNVFIMDFRNSGNSYYAPCTMGYNESKELLKAISYLKSKYGVKEIAILAFSMGAATSALAALEIEKTKIVTLKALILDSPYSSIEDVVRYKSNSLNIHNNFYIYLILKYYSFRAKFDYKKVDLTSILPKIKNTHILIIHGYKDKIIPIKQSKKILISIMKTQIKPQLWFVRDSNHTEAFDKHQKEYINKVLEFLKSSKF